MAAIASATAMNTNATITKWVCDVCKIASFEDYDEACAHETQCTNYPSKRLFNNAKQQQQQQQQQPKEEKKQPPQKKEIHSFFQKPKLQPKQNEVPQQQDVVVVQQPITIEDDSPVSSPSSTGSSSSSKRRHCNTNPTTNNNNEDENLQQQQHPPKSRRTSKNTKSKKGPAAPLASIFTTRKANNHKTATTTTATPLAVIFNNNNNNNHSSTKREKMPASAQVSSSCTTTTEQFQTITNNIMNSTGTTTQPQSCCPTTKSMLGEHRAADFLAKRRKKQQEERARQQKRNALRQQQQQQQQNETTIVKNNNGMSVEVVHIDVEDEEQQQLESSTTMTIQKRQSLALSAPRFPRNSHVISSSSSSSSEAQKFSSNGETPSQKWIPSNALDKVTQSLTQTLKYPHGRPDSIIEKDMTVESTTTTTTTTPESGAKGGNMQQQQSPLEHAMGVLLTPPPPKSKKDDTFSTTTELWSTKYAIRNLPSDVIGRTNRDETSALLCQFVEDWKIERTEALERMAERQKNAGKKKKRKTKKAKKKEEDLAWDDDGGELEGLCNVCVVTGPSGSGKTNLIHAVASTKGCQVLEINTTQTRGGTYLKRIMEEATQSHSFQLGSSMNDQEDEDFLHQQHVFHNNQGRYDDDDSDTDDEDAKESKKKKGSSVSIILIDEVDNIYENNGDAGFWTALSSVAKKAKCPIFLTANHIPEYLLNSSSIRYQHFAASLPTPLECAGKILSIVKMENFGLRRENFSTGESIKEQLAYIAQLCNCDLRRIYLELQLFSLGSSSRISSNADAFLRRTRGNGKESSLLLSSSTTATTDDERNDCVSNDHHFPIITQISPRTLPSVQYSLLTLKGRNFLSKLPPITKRGQQEIDISWEVYIGDQLCPAMRILDDTTILAICPPCSSDHDKSLSLKSRSSFYCNETGKESNASRYAPVSIRSCARVGIISTMDSIRRKNELCNGNPITSLPQLTRVEYSFPPPPNKIVWKGEFDSDDDEHQFDDRKMDCRTGKQSGKDLTYTSMEHEIVGNDVSSTMTKNSLAEPLKSELDIQVLASEILDEGESAWKSRRQVEEIAVGCKEQSNAKFWCPHPTQTIDEMGAWSKRAEVASDIALLEESFEQGGIPYLSGATRGFGSDLVDDFSGGSETDSKKLGRAANVKPPCNEKLVASGWNDNFCFFGGSDTFVTSTTSMRERQLLRRTEASVRGLSLAESDPGQTAEDIDESMTFPDIAFVDTPDARFPVSEENALLPNRTQAPLFALLELLQKENNDGQSTANPLQIDDPKFTSLFDLKREQNLYQTIDLLSFLLAEDAEAKMFCRGLSRFTGSCVSLPGEGIDRPLFLDYVPALRLMSVYESAAQFAYDEVLKIDPDKATVRSSRRSTRQNKEKGREHYFDCLSKDFQRVDTEWPGIKLGEEFMKTGFRS